MQPQVETAPDRRNQDALLNMVATVLDEQKQMHKKLTNHVEDEAIRFAKMFAAAFPGGDPGQHRRWHEADLVRIEEKAQFWKTMKTEVGKWGLLGCLAFLVVSAWARFLKGPL